MKALAAALLALAATGAAWAQAQPPAPVDATRAEEAKPQSEIDAERARIKAERAEVEARFAARQKACRAKFAVTDCVLKAQHARNDALNDLRRQEIVLNDTERRARAAARQREIDERNSPEHQRQAEERRKQALADQKAREERAEQKAADKAKQDAEHAGQAPRVKTAPGAHGPQGTPREPHANQPNGPSPAQAAANKQAYEQRLQEAEAHKREVQEKLAKRAKPAASDLPIPPMK
jgi:hypothetical protein